MKRGYLDRKERAAMKKILVMMMVSAMCVVFCACGSVGNDSTGVVAENYAEDEIVYGTGEAGLKDTTAEEADMQARNAAAILNGKEDDDIRCVSDEEGVSCYAGDITCYYDDGERADYTFDEMYELYEDDPEYAEELFNAYNTERIVGYDRVKKVERDGTVILESGVVLECFDMELNQDYFSELYPGLFVVYEVDSLMLPVGEYGYIYNGEVIGAGCVVDWYV